jgi:hypothetical protein
MDITDFSINEWVILKWKLNNELGKIDSIYPETNTIRINLNPYKFCKITTIENFKNVIKLEKDQKEKLEILTGGIDFLEKKLSSLKEKINSEDLGF